jgi:hypothetical protein
MDNDDVPRGWVKPTRARTVDEVRALIAQRREEIAGLERELFNLVEGPRLEALAQIRNLMRAHELTVDEVCDRRLPWRIIRASGSSPASDEAG